MSLALAHRSPRSPLQQPNRLRVVGKLAIALRSMIHDGVPFQQAAEDAGTTTRAVREALDKPHVQKWIRREKQMRLERARLANITELERIRSGNGAAAVSAIAMLEEMAAPDGQSAATIASTTPGVTINIINGISGNSGQAIERQPVTIEGESLDAGARASVNRAHDARDHPQDDEKAG